MSLRWSQRALRDLDQIWAFIAQDNPRAARRWVHQIQARARAATTAPLAGRVVPEVGLPEIREVFQRSYRVVYRVEGDELYVLTVFEGHQRFPHHAMPDEVDGAD